MKMKIMMKAANVYGEHFVSGMVLSIPYILCQFYKVVLFIISVSQMGKLSTQEAK